MKHTDLNLENHKKKILITGASSGLGKILSIYFNKKFKSVICVGGTAKKIKQLKNSLKNKDNFFFHGDLTNSAKQKKLMLFLKKHNDINAVIHCLGGGFGLKNELLSKKDLLKLITINLINQSEINNLVIKNMVKKKISGKIIHVSGIAGLESIASTGYSVSKAALIAYSKSLSKSFLKKNIFIKTIILGAFETKDNSFSRLKNKNLKAYKFYRDNKFEELREFLPEVNVFSFEEDSY